MASAKLEEVQPGFSREGKHDMVSRATVAGARILALAASAILLFTANAFLDPQAAFAQAKPASYSAGGPGPDACAGCHQDSVDSFSASIHGKKGHAKSPASNGGCVVCHANGAEHVKAGGGKGAGGIVNPGPRNKSMSAEAKTEICLSCHSDNRHLAFWDSGRHRKNDVTCTNCHNTHGPNGSLLRISDPVISQKVNTNQVPQQEVCYTCHRDIRSLVMRPSHHPIAEGKVKCSSCHNPHGALSPSMVNNESTRDLCLSCHADKRGPYMWEHAPVEENCLTCHNPHGSRTVKLLKEKVPNLCQDCHDASQHPGTAYDMTEAFKGQAPSARFYARGCLNCHSEIHGSNAPGSRGKRFVREGG
jgi:DmsE family decaheme c-type cytochrome